MLEDILNQILKDGRAEFELPHSTSSGQAEKGRITIRRLALIDLENLKQLRHALSDRSRELVPCYPWDDEPKLHKALEHAIEKAVQKIDESYIMLADDEIAGHFFLWKARSNPHSQKYALEVPELGVMIADKYQGLGLGSMAVKLLVALAKSMDKDAVELTTDKSNTAAWNTYLKAGFEYTGDINNPLEVDVTEAFSGEARVVRTRVERQMAHIINQDKKSAILDYLAAKREEAKNL